MLKMLLRNSRSGRIGSAARRSASRNNTVSTTKPAPRPMISAESQAYLVPPHTPNSTMQTDAAAIRNMPRMSSLGRLFCLARCRVKITTARAMIPIGTLT